MRRRRNNVVPRLTGHKQSGLTAADSGAGHALGRLHPESRSPDCDGRGFCVTGQESASSPSWPAVRVPREATRARSHVRSPTTHTPSSSRSAPPSASVTGSPRAGIAPARGDVRQYLAGRVCNVVAAHEERGEARRVVWRHLALHAQVGIPVSVVLGELRRRRPRAPPAASIAASRADSSMSSHALIPVLPLSPGPTGHPSCRGAALAPTANHAVAATAATTITTRAVTFNLPLSDVSPRLRSRRTISQGGALHKPRRCRRREDAKRLERRVLATSPVRSRCDAALRDYSQRARGRGRGAGRDRRDRHPTELPARSTRHISHTSRVQ